MATLLAVSFGSLPAGVSCFMAQMLFSTWRELLNPATTSEPEIMALGGKTLVFPAQERDLLISQVASAKVALVLVGVVTGFFAVQMGFGGIYKVAPFILIVLVFLTLRKTYQSEVRSTLISLAVLTAIIFSMSWIPALLPVMYMAMAANPKKEKEQKSSAAFEINKSKAQSALVFVYGVLAGLLPGANPSTLTTAVGAEGVDKRLFCVSINALAEGVSLGIFMFGRATGKTPLSEAISKFQGEILPVDVAVPALVGLVVAIALLPTFIKVLDRVMEHDTQWHPLGVILTWCVSIFYASVNPLNFVFPYSGLLVGVGVTVIAQLIGQAAIRLPDKVRPLTVSIPIILL